MGVNPNVHILGQTCSSLVKSTGLIIAPGNNGICTHVGLVFIIEQYMINAIAD